MHRGPHPLEYEDTNPKTSVWREREHFKATGRPLKAAQEEEEEHEEELAYLRHVRTLQPHSVYGGRGFHLCFFGADVDNTLFSSGSVIFLRLFYHEECCVWLRLFMRLIYCFFSNLS